MLCREYSSEALIELPGVESELRGTRCIMCHQSRGHRYCISLAKPSRHHSRQAFSALRTFLRTRLASFANNNSTFPYEPPRNTSTYLDQTREIAAFTPHTPIAACDTPPSSPGHHGPILSPTPPTRIQPAKPPILPLHLPTTRLRPHHPVTSPLLWPAIPRQQSSLRRRIRLRARADIRPRRQWEDGGARRVENGVVGGVWNGRV